MKSEIFNIYTRFYSLIVLCSGKESYYGWRNIQAQFTCYMKHSENQSLVFSLKASAIKGRWEDTPPQNWGLLILNKDRMADRATTLEWTCPSPSLNLSHKSTGSRTTCGRKRLSDLWFNLANLFLDRIVRKKPAILEVNSIYYIVWPLSLCSFLSKNLSNS